MILDVTIAAGDDYVSDVSAFKVRWWRDRYFTGEQAHFWPEELEDCPTWQVNPAYQLVTRDRVFAIAATDGPHRHVRTAAAAYVWGVGKSAYQIGWLARAFTTDPAAVERKLGGAAEVLAEEGPVAAYRSMLLPGAPNNIKFMGPAYFTKFLGCLRAGAFVRRIRFIAICLNGYRASSSERCNLRGSIQLGRR